MKFINCGPAAPKWLDVYVLEITFIDEWDERNSSEIELQEEELEAMEIDLKKLYERFPRADEDYFEGLVNKERLAQNWPGDELYLWSYSYYDANGREHIITVEE